MKIRTGFVSNSSSSSFCIIGLPNWDRDFRNIIKALPSLEEWKCHAEGQWYPARGTKDLRVITQSGEESYIGFRIRNIKDILEKTDVLSKLQDEIYALCGLEVPTSRFDLYYGEAGE